MEFQLYKNCARYGSSAANMYNITFPNKKVLNQSKTFFRGVSKTTIFEKKSRALQYIDMIQMLDEKVKGGSERREKKKETFFLELRGLTVCLHRELLRRASECTKMHGSLGSGKKTVFFPSFV